MTLSRNFKSMNTVNIDQAEVRKFSKSADEWWDLNGDFRTLHTLNPLRVRYIQDSSPIASKRVLDVGCGGGILSEALAREGAMVTGIDASERAIDAAREHQQIGDLNISYRCTTAEQFAEEHASEFDVVTCMELLEHVPDPSSLIQACARMLKKDGHLYLSTLNRTPKSWALAIVAAEHLLNLIPRGTHQHRNFIRPSELYDWCENANLRMQDITGLHYNPLSNSFRLGPGVDVNYFARCQRN